MYFPRWVNTYEYLLRILGGLFKGHGMLHNAMKCCTMLQCALFWRIWAQEVPPLLCEAFGWLRRRKTTTGRSDSRYQISILVTSYRMSRARRARPTEPLSPCRKLVPVGSAARFQAEISAVLLPCKVKRVMLPFFLLFFFCFCTEPLEVNFWHRPHNSHTRQKVQLIASFRLNWSVTPHTVYFHVHYFLAVNNYRTFSMSQQNKMTYTSYFLHVFF